MLLNRLYASMIVTLAAVNEPLAQATPPATSGSPAAPATTDGGASWLWILIGLAIIAGLVWYVMRGRSRTTMAGTTGTSGTSGTTTGRTNVYDNDTHK